MPGPINPIPSSGPTPAQPWWQRVDWLELAGNIIPAGINMINARRQQAAADRQARSNEAMQREFAQHGIRWRVEDAKAAGLHPLYALGAQTPQFQPVYSQDSMGPAVAEAGQQVGRAIRALGTYEEREAQRLSLELLRGQVAEQDARAGILADELAAMRRERGYTWPSGFQTFPLDNPDIPSGGLMRSSVIDGQPDSLDPRAGSDRTVSNVHPYPMWTQFQLTDGRKMVLPGGVQGDPSEALESMSESMVLMWMTYQENRMRYGQQFTDDIFGRYFGGDWLAQMRAKWLERHEGVNARRRYPAEYKR